VVKDVLEHVGRAVENAIVSYSHTLVAQTHA
jgi:hypothetical protein